MLMTILLLLLMLLAIDDRLLDLRLLVTTAGAGLGTAALYLSLLLRESLTHSD